MRKFSAQAHQDPTPAEALDGSYSAFAQKATLRVTNHKGDLERHLNAEDFRMKMKAADVPFKLLAQLTTKALRKRSMLPVRCILNSRSSVSDPGPRVPKKLRLQAFLKPAARAASFPRQSSRFQLSCPNLFWKLWTLLFEGRAQMPRQSVKRFMTPKDLPEGRVWELKMKESRRGSLTARSFTVDNIEP